MAADNSDHEELYLAAEENLETPGNLSWIHSQKGIDYFKEVLRGLSMAENETKEPDIAKSLLSLIEKKEKNSTEIVRNFLKEISNFFYKCYQLVQHVKCPNKKALVLERNFASLSSHSGPTNYCPGLPETARGLPETLPETARVNVTLFITW
jgi:hypothetical protein